ncbi:torsin family 4, member Ab isoform X2 [Electrophorus electricus]|uniref:Torsin-1A C-terminal domain-containing protein n=1 Tax=Electrophorus electricus TaxID=8005 RepID=A0A4W4F5R9_ELEEL|nr:torsin family 4, member Ab isoform X2 [Electrophorus electricus]
MTSPMDRTDDELDTCMSNKGGEKGGDKGGDRGKGGESAGVRGTPGLSLQLKAVMRIRSKYLRRGRSEQCPAPHALLRGRLPGPSSLGGSTSARPESPHRRRGRRRTKGVLFPSDGRKYLPKNKEQSRAKPFLFLFIIIVFMQVYNAIENLDDHMEKYDLEGLERTLHREVFGQQEALHSLMYHLRDYLSTYAHQRPLVLSLHGAHGVGKSHLGRLLVRHFRSVVGAELVVQYFSLHHCPLQDSPEFCASELAGRVKEVAAQAEEAELIPLILLDEVELLRPALLDGLRELLQLQRNELLNIVYIFLSTLGDGEVTSHVLQNGTVAGAARLLRNMLPRLHSLWAEPGVELIPLSLLERGHVVQCFLEEMTDEGFYPDPGYVERLAGELAYHRAGGKQYAKTGCKQVVAKVNLL